MLNPFNGIITALEAIGMPWNNKDYGVPNDYDYVYNHSAMRFISRLVDSLLIDGELPQIEINALADIIANMYSKKWERIYATFELEYNPISNYDMTEVMTNDTTEHTFGHSLTRTDNLTLEDSGDDVTRHNTTDTRTDALTEIDEKQVQGFNSNTYVNSDKETVDNTGTQSISRTGTDTFEHGKTETSTGTQTHAETGKNTDVRNYRLTRSGNIGVTTSQQMIESERQLWAYNFVQMVYSDIDRVLTIDYFKMEDC